MLKIEPEVIVNYDLEGNLRPYKMRFQAEDQSLIVVKIDRILFTEDNKRDGMVKIRCECVINTIKRILDIYFNKALMKWHFSI